MRLSLFPFSAVEFEEMSVNGVAASSTGSSSSSTSETTAADSGVDSEVSPSSPDSACKALVKDGDEDDIEEDDEDEDEEIMATAETLLALSGKSSSASSTKAEALPEDVVLPGANQGT